jgi:hypothetical protein
MFLVSFSSICILTCLFFPLDHVLAQNNFKYVLGKLDWVNGTLTHYPSAHVTGNIVIIKAPQYPYDPLLRELALLRPAAVLIVISKKGVPGDGMFYVDGKNRTMINFPVAELFSNSTQDPLKIPEGTYVSVRFERNQWKDIKLGTKFQAVVGSFLSLWQLAILTIGAYRLYQFYCLETTSWLSIGPICLILEMIAVALRLALTAVDPFWTYRMLPTSASNALFTLHFPFALSSGILLTFYCTFEKTKKRCDGIRIRSPEVSSSLSQFQLSYLPASLFTYIS